MHSPIGKVIASALVGSASYASHALLAGILLSKLPPVTLDEVVQFALLQLALHFGITYGKPEPEAAK